MKTLQQELPKRFVDATSKLYEAYHNGDLNPMSCKKCAVGNICDNNSDWRNIKEYGEFMALFNKNNRAEIVIKKSGYSVEELMNIEAFFQYGTLREKRYEYIFNNTLSSNKELQFKGLCAVIEYLCILDNIPNIMDFTSLFETENDAPKYELCEVFN